MIFPGGSSKSGETVILTCLTTFEKGAIAWYKDSQCKYRFLLSCNCFKPFQGFKPLQIVPNPGHSSLRFFSHQDFFDRIQSRGNMKIYFISVLNANNRITFATNTTYSTINSVLTITDTEDTADSGLYELALSCYIL